MKVSIVCPFYNEELILERAISEMVSTLRYLPCEFELILVNDGSRDDGLEIARRASIGVPEIRLLGYEINRGRGFAIRFGAREARGDILITTEIDLSWGGDIVARLLEKFDAHPDADMVIASPNLSGGDYRNVPLMRVLLSKVGNRIIRSSIGSKITMYTGMTRGYRRDVFLSLPLEEDEKEFHLEVAHKALVYGLKIYEIPCVLEWKSYKLSNGAKRKSSSRVLKLIRTHMLFALFSAPFRYMFSASVITFVMSFGFLALSINNFIEGFPSATYLTVGLTIFVISVLLFAIGVLSYQGGLLQKELWIIRRVLQTDEARKKDSGGN